MKNTKNLKKRLSIINHTKRPTALDLLFDFGHIDEAMRDAALRYAELCHLRPAGGPHISRSMMTLRPRKISPQSDSMPDHLEALWHRLNDILCASPITATINKIVCDDNMALLYLLKMAPNTMNFFKDALQNLAQCLELYDSEGNAKKKRVG